MVSPRPGDGHLTSLFARSSATPSPTDKSSLFSLHVDCSTFSPFCLFIVLGFTVGRPPFLRRPSKLLPPATHDLPVFIFVAPLTLTIGLFFFIPFTLPTVLLLCPPPGLVKPFDICPSHDLAYLASGMSGCKFLLVPRSLPAILVARDSWLAFSPCKRLLPPSAS